MAGHIYLIGFMASGKSTLGRLLASAIGRPFIDTDLEIEKRFGASIHQIFTSEGEVAFRRMEKDLLLELSSRKEDCVIATGGGMVLIDGALDVMKSSGKVFFLKRSLKQILPILRKDNDRPLAINKGKKELYFKYKARLKTYRKANFRIYNRNEQTALHKILNMIK